MKHAWCAAVVAACATLLSPSTSSAQSSYVKALELVYPEATQQPAFPDEISADSPNAAARYLWLFSKMDPRLRSLAPWVRADTLRIELDPESEAPGTTAELRAGLMAEQAWIRDVINATRLPHFDLGYSDKWAIRLADEPRTGFLMSTRRTFAILQADAVRLWGEGEHEQAADRVVASSRLAVQISRSSTPTLNEIMAEALQTVAWETLRAMLREGQPPFPEKHRAELRELLRKLDPDDPFRVRAGWRRRVAQQQSFIREQLADGKIGEPLLLSLAELQVPLVRQDALAADFVARAEADGAPPPTFAAFVKTMAADIKGFDQLRHDQVTAKFIEANELVAQIERMWTEEDALAKIRAIEKTLDQDTTGMIRVVLLAPSGFQRTWRESVTLVKEMISALEKAD